MLRDGVTLQCPASLDERRGPGGLSPAGGRPCAARFSSVSRCTGKMPSRLHKPGSVAEHIAEVGDANVLTSVIVAYELRHATAKRGSRRLTRPVLGALTIKPLESDVEHIYAAIRGALQERGTPNWCARRADCGTRRALGAVCVTDNWLNSNVYRAA